MRMCDVYSLAVAVYKITTARQRRVKAQATDGRGPPASHRTTAGPMVRRRGGGTGVQYNNIRQPFATTVTAPLLPSMQGTIDL